jgi:hypothetical protein
VPPALLGSTTKAASAIAAGTAVHAVAAAKVAALSEGVLRTMLLTRITIAAVALVAGMMLLAGGMWTYRTLAAPADQLAIASQAVQPKREGRTFTVTGIVTDEQDKLLDGVVVDILRRAYAKDADNPKIEQFGMTKTNADGRFEITTLYAIWDKEARSGFLLKVSTPGFFPQWLSVDKTFDPDKNLKIVLKSNKEEAAARAHSADNLKEIALAMHSIHGQTQSLPAHAIYSKDGKTPLLSWRVTILPHIGHTTLYQEFKLDEPWDSAHNKQLIPKMPRLYALPGATDANEGETFYQVIFGPGTLFDGSKKMRFQDVRDGTSNTLLVVEAGARVVWTRPDELLQLPGDKDTPLPIGGLFTEGFNVLLCDGQVRFVPHDVPVAAFRALITPAARD